MTKDTGGIFLRPYMAGRGGFEPPVEFIARQSLSRRSRSATPAPPRVLNCSLLCTNGGGRGIRTHVGFHQTCFQDRRLKPLGHPSIFPAGRCHFIMSDTHGQGNSYSPEGAGEKKVTSAPVSCARVPGGSFARRSVTTRSPAAPEALNTTSRMSK